MSRRFQPFVAGSVEELFGPPRPGRFRFWWRGIGILQGRDTEQDHELPAYQDSRFSRPLTNAEGLGGPAVPAEQQHSAPAPPYEGGIGPAMEPERAAMQPGHEPTRPHSALILGGKHEGDWPPTYGQ